MDCRVWLQNVVVHGIHWVLAPCVREGSSIFSHHSFCLTQQLHLYACPSHLSVSATALLLHPARAAQSRAVLHFLWLR